MARRCSAVASHMDCCVFPLPVLSVPVDDQHRHEGRHAQSGGPTASSKTRSNTGSISDRESEFPISGNFLQCVWELAETQRRIRSSVADLPYGRQKGYPQRGGGQCSALATTKRGSACRHASSRSSWPCSDYPVITITAVRGTEEFVGRPMKSQLLVDHFAISLLELGHSEHVLAVVRDAVGNHRIHVPVDQPVVHEV